MAGIYGRVEIANLFTKRAIVLSFVIHGFILALNLTFAPPAVKPRTDAIQVTMTPTTVFTPPPKEKILAKESPLKESEVIKEKPKVKVVAGTKKIVPKATDLGDKNAEKVQKVQKGDPVSKNMTKYKPGTEFRKTPTTNIGTGASGAAFPSAKMGGGSGDTYKAPNFATKSVNGMAQLGSRFKLKNADDFGAGAGMSGGIGDGQGRGYGDGVITGSRNGTVETAKMINNVGSLSGATVGKIGSSKGSEGLSTKGTVVLAGVPDETVILGSMDPNVIRRILMEHIVQFRYCYQSELDSTAKPKDVSGVIQLNFSIGQSGEVQNYNIGGGQTITSKVKSCVGGVLKDIQFPTPKGGGIVEVKQPMNFYPKSY
jgi:hypothetical protein